MVFLPTLDAIVYFTLTPILRIVVFLCLVFSLGGCATFQTKREYLVFGFHADEWEPGWKVRYSAELPNQYLIEFIREEDDINNWNELLTIHSFPPLWGGTSPEDAFNKLKALMEKECPGAIKWNVIDKDEKSILYEWQSRPCRGWTYQHEIAKMIYGKYNTFVLRYTKKNYQMPDEVRSEWITRFSKAKIETSLE